MSCRGVIKTISYHISSSCKTIHRHIKSTFIITIKSYLFGRLFNDSKQKISSYKMMKIIKNNLPNPIHSQFSGRCVVGRLAIAVFKPI